MNSAHKKMRMGTGKSQRATPLEDRPLSSSHKEYERCEIIDVNIKNYTCDVRTESGVVFKGVPWLNPSIDPSGYGGEINVPKVRQRYVLSTRMGEPLLLSALPIPRTPGTTVGEHSILPAGNSSVDTSKATKYDYRAGLPRDLQQGDWVRITQDGNLLAVLEGGTTILKATEMAKVLATPVGDLLQLVGRNMDIHTDFGEIAFRNDNGKVSMSLRGGSQQLTESSPEKESFTIRADMGAEGELVDFRTTDTKGHTLGQVHWKPNGDVDKIAVGNVVDTIGSDYENDTAGSFSVAAGKDVAISADGQSTLRSNANMTLDSGGNLNISSGNSTIITANKDVAFTVSRQLSTAVTGSITAVPGYASYPITVTNGSMVIDIGNPLAGDIQKTLSSYELTLNSVGGNIWFKMPNPASGNFIVNTARPAQITLGGVSVVGPFAPVMWEPFSTWLSAFGTLLDTHIHACAVGPTTPPVAPPFVTSGGPAAIPNMRSLMVTLGG